jgi:hypothetical protein
MSTTFESLIMRDTRANQPAAGKPGRLYYVTDENALERDNGATWDSVEGVNTGYSEGTSFPVSPSTDDKFYRTDRNILYYYDGTRWLSVQVFRETFFSSDNANPTGSESASLGGWSTRQGDNGIYVVSLDATTLVVTTNDGSNYWPVEFKRINQENSATALGSFNTSAHTATNWYDTSVAIGAVLDSGVRLVTCATGTKTGTPGNIWVYPCIVYRLIG